MQQIILCVILIASLNFALTYADGKECKRRTPSTFWQIYATPFFRRGTYCNTILENEPDNGQYKKCRNDISEYFDLNYVDSEVVEEYAKMCKKLMGAEWSRCADIILHLNSLKLCWTMETAPKLLNMLSRDNFLTDENLKQIDISYNKFTEFEKAKINLQKCSNDLQYFYENTMDVLNYFMLLRKEHIGKGGKYELVCDCEQISGIYKIVSKRKIFEHSLKFQRSPRIDADGQGHESYSALSFSKEKIPPYENPNNVIFKHLGDDTKTELSDLYNTICLDSSNTLMKDYWTKNRLDLLAEKKEYMSTRAIKGVLIGCFEIVKAGWYDLSKPESQWPVEYLLSKIAPFGDSVDLLSVEIIAQVIRAGFSATDYQEFTDVIVQVYGFNTLECGKDILDAVFQYDSNGDGKNKAYWRNKKGKRGFNDHLRNLLTLYTRTRRFNFQKNCKEFSEKIALIEMGFYSTNWTEDHINQLLRKAIFNYFSIEQFSTCLTFSTKLTKTTDTYITNNKDKTDWIPNEKEQEDFRLKLFSDGYHVDILCYDVSHTYDTYDYNGLMKIYKTLLTNK